MRKIARLLGLSFLLFGLSACPKSGESGAEEPAAAKPEVSHPYEPHADALKKAKHMGDCSTKRRDCQMACEAEGLGEACLAKCPNC